MCVPAPLSGKVRSENCPHKCAEKEDLTSVESLGATNVLIQLLKSLEHTIAGKPLELALRRVQLVLRQWLAQ